MSADDRREFAGGADTQLFVDIEPAKYHFNVGDRNSEAARQETDHVVGCAPRNGGFGDADVELIAFYFADRIS